MTQKSDLTKADTAAMVRVILILSILLATLWGSDVSGLLALV